MSAHRKLYDLDEPLSKRKTPKQHDTDHRQLGLGDICRNYHGGNPESKKANLRVASVKSFDRARILKFLAEQGWTGATCDEIETELKMSHQTASARCAELKEENEVIKSGTRKTRTGCPAAVLILRELVG
jgi:hypothetical protein